MNRNKNVYDKNNAEKIGLDGNVLRSHIKREKMSYRIKLLIFFILFVALLMTYMFSFINGTDIGLLMEDISLSFLGAITGAISTVLSIPGISALSLIGSGLVRFFSIGPIAVITMSIIVSYMISGVIALIVSIRYTWKKKQSIERKFLSTSAGDAGIK